VRASLRSLIPLAAAGALLLAACSSGGSSGTASGAGPDDDAGGGAPDATTTSTEPTTTTTELVPRAFTIGASGDILIHAPVQRSAAANAGGAGFDFDPMFDDVRELITASDLALCHQETPISADNTGLSVPNTLSFNAPRELAVGLVNAGFDGCDTASNHTWDRTLTGVQQTNEVLDSVGLRHVGGAGSAEEMASPPIFTVKGVQIGHLAYSYTVFNNFGPNTQFPPEAPWMERMLWPVLDVEGILADAAAIKARGAEVVVVSMHWGDQYIAQPTADQTRLAEALLASPDVDLILGDHVHVIQPCQKVGDKYVIYGMGNFLSNQAPGQAAGLTPENQDGAYFEWSFTETEPGVFRATGMTFAPTAVQTQGHKILRATPETNPASHDRTVKWVNLLGPGACDATPAY
jgi:poly-gamma-glutamate capsule biosynthesis protein CapA/YwtB (metallophosphatase superfamily)